MKSANKYIVNVTTVGLISLIILSVVLFWCRKLCQGILFGDVLKQPIANVLITPSSLVPELDSGPDVVEKSSITASISQDVVFESLGVVQNVWSIEQGQLGDFFIQRSDKKSEGKSLILYDEKSGLFVYYDIFKNNKAKRRGWAKKVKLYAGPNGISKTPGKTLGRFAKPCLGLYKSTPQWRGGELSFVFFDKTLSQFLRINFQQEELTKGPKLSEDYKPIQISWLMGLKKNVTTYIFEWTPPLRKATPQDRKNKRKIRGHIFDANGQSIDLVSVKENMHTYGSRQYDLVLDESGQIRTLNKKTLELSSSVGYLPSAPPQPNRISSAKPNELLAYEVRPFTIDGEYAGTIAASISREGLGLRVAVFDPNGNLIEQKGNYVNPLEIPGGPVLVTIEYILENLQPAVLGVASYFTASSFEAAAGHRAIFILPNSFVAMFARDAIGIIGPFFGALFIISPSIILGLLLAWRMRIDAAAVGLSGRAKYYWTIGTILFGLSAYITYRLTRPKIRLVTCTNCGKLRRPDMDICHCCGSRWLVPDLIRPTWRVIDS